MKKTIIATFLIACLGAGLPAVQVLAAPESGEQTTQENAGQSWQKALETQVALAEAKVSLLQAQIDLWMQQNKTEALHSLEKARTSLDEAMHSADQVTQARIVELETQLDQANNLLQEKGREADIELHLLANHSESVLNSALARVEGKSAVLRDETATRYSLVRAKAAALNARISLEVDNSPKRAQQALQDAEIFLLQAKESASKETVEQIARLQDKAKAAQQAVREKADDAKSRIGTLVILTEDRLQVYDKTVKGSEEAKRLQKRYAQLQAKAALLQSSLAAKKDATGEQAAAYLDESKAWYESLKLQASQRYDKELSDMSTRIDEAKQAIKRKDKQVRAKITELLEQAAAIFKDEESTK